ARSFLIYCRVATRTGAAIRLTANWVTKPPNSPPTISHLEALGLDWAQRPSTSKVASDQPVQRRAAGLPSAQSRQPTLPEALRSATGRISGRRLLSRTRNSAAVAGPQPFPTTR